MLARSCGLSALVPPELRERLYRELGKRLARHFEAPQWEHPIWLSEQTEPLWGTQSQRVFLGRGLRKLRLFDLRWLILYEAERLARIVVDGRADHTFSERVMAVRGALRRIGQVYRELCWRCGEQRALAHVDLALSALYWW